MLGRIVGTTLLAAALLPAQAGAQLPERLLTNVMPVPYEFYECRWGAEGNTCINTVEAAGVSAGCTQTGYMSSYTETCGAESEHVSADCTEHHSGSSRGISDRFGCWATVAGSEAGCAIYEWSQVPSHDPEGRIVTCEVHSGG